MRQEFLWKEINRCYSSFLAFSHPWSRFKSWWVLNSSAIPFSSTRNVLHLFLSLNSFLFSLLFYKFFSLYFRSFFKVLALDFSYRCRRSSRDTFLLGKRSVTLKERPASFLNYRLFCRLRNDLMQIFRFLCVS